jgi:phosphate transport system permease protein
LGSPPPTPAVVKPAPVVGSLPPTPDDVVLPLPLPVALLAVVLLPPVVALLLPVVPLLAVVLPLLPLVAASAGPASGTGRTVLTVAVVLAVMILPIVTALSREVFLQVPRLHEEAALALGATRWEMIRMAVLPFARPGIVSASMLGLGRALGETMAVTIILSVSGAVTFNLISQANPSTIAANIALDFPESSGLAINALIATGLVLFAITLVTNLAARAIIARQNTE